MRHIIHASCITPTATNRFRFFVRVVPIVVLSGALFLAGCLKEKTADAVLIDEASTVIQQVDAGTSTNVPGPIGVRAVIADILAAKGHTGREVKSVTVVGASYGCLNLQGSHDWTVSGQIQAQRTDGTPGPLVTVLDYSDVSVQELLDQKVTAPLTAEGVDLINQAMIDYLDGASPVLEFQAGGSGADPSPSALDPMVFEWKLWLTVQIVFEYDVTVPDIF